MFGCEYDQIESLEGIAELKQLCCRQKKKFTVSIEGNIGCGKTTLVNYFNKFPKVNCIKEPVEKWCNLQGHNALQLLYEDSKRWAFTFNYYAMLTRVDMHQKKLAVPVKMLERSLYSTRYVFVENSYRTEQLTGLEYTILVEWFDHLIKQPNTDVDLFVYLRASPEVCYERLKKRNRKEEAGVPIDFINELHKLHEEWFIEKKFPIPAPLLVLDASQDLPVMKQLYEDKKSEILFGCA